VKIPFLSSTAPTPLDAVVTAPLSAPARPELTGGRSVGVVVLHGFTGSPASMRPWAEDLNARGYAVEMPLLPGHGTTWVDANTTTWRDWYAAAEAAFEKIAAEVDRVVVAGLSMGGCLSLRLAEEKQDRVAGVVVVNPWLNMTDPRFRLLPILKRVVGSVGANTNDIKKPNQDEYAYDRIPVRAAATVPHMWRDVVPRLGTVTQPVLFFHTSVDHTIDQSSVGILRDHIGSADFTERMLTESYHVATLDNDAETIFAESADFVARVTAPTAG
jgi:carboxylesterase